MEIKDIETSMPIVVGRILSLLPARALVLIAGGSCSGKSYFTRMLSSRLREKGASVTVVGQDSYFRDIGDPAVPRDSDSRVVFDSPDSYHNDQLIRDISLLLAGNRAISPVYDVFTNTRTGVKPLEPSEVILVDGLFAISHADVAYPGTLRIFIDASREIRIERRIERDKKYGAPEDVIRSVFLDKVEPYHRQFVELQRGASDIVIANQWRRDDNTS